jgi:hypothetical protein
MSCGLLQVSAKTLKRAVGEKTRSSFFFGGVFQIFRPFSAMEFGRGPGACILKLHFQRLYSLAFNLFY